MRHTTYFEKACGLLPDPLQRIALSADRICEAEELRLRLGLPMGLVLPEGEVDLAGSHVHREDIDLVLDRATEFSRYTAKECMASGYVTAENGIRVGVCGTAIPENGGNTGLRDISSLSIRIPGEYPGIGEPLLPNLTEDGHPVSTLILSPPGGGKTTLLRDLIRLISNDHRVSLVDERGELAAVHRGLPQMDIGRHTDVLNGCPKSVGIRMLLRAMGPEVIAVDELATLQDTEAIRSAAGCGVILLATVHGRSTEELRRHPVLGELLACGIFRRAVVITGTNPRRYSVEVLA